MAEVRQCAIETCRVKLAESNKGTMCFRCTEKYGRKVPTGSGLSETRGARRGPVPTVRTASLATTPKPELLGGVEMCVRGCGYTRHRGRCKGAKVAEIMRAVRVASPDTVADAEAEQMTTGGKRKMDILISKTVRMEDVPMDAAPTPKVQGRLGMLWAKLLTLKPGEVEQVENRDRGHGLGTLCHMRKKAKAIGREVGDKRVGSTLYIWLLPVKKAGE